MARYYSAIAQDTTLTANITNAANSMTVSALVGFPASYPYVVAVDYNGAAEELVLVTGAAGTTLTITRGFNGSTPVAHNTGAVIRHVIVAQDLTDAQNHYAATTSVHGITDTSTLVTTSGGTKSIADITALVTKTDTQTLTNKTIDYNSNTITNLPGTTFDLTLNAQTGTTYTLALTDKNKLVTLNNAGAITLTLPPSGTAAFTTGMQVHIQQIGAGQVSIVAGSGVTITSTGATAAAPKLRAQYSAATIICTGTSTFTVIGDIA